jgi:hypothetical protein
MECHVTFRDVDECTISAMQDVICFLILKDSPHSLAMKHLLDVSTYFSPSEEWRFSVEPYFRLYPSRYRMAFASSKFFNPSLQQHASR